MTDRNPRQTDRLPLFLAALIAALAAILLGTTSSASLAPATETRIRASDQAVAVLARLTEHVCAGQHQGRAEDSAETVVASDVAANSASRSCRANSFTGDTLVLMADGSKKPIRDVRLGDLVMAADPVTGERGPRKVTDLIRHGGLHTMVAVRLADGTTIDATDQHPFWVTSRGDGGAWVEAIDLRAGDQVQTADGHLLWVASVRINDEDDVRAFNLTVDDLHTYFVSDQEILVHNCGVDPLDERGLGHAVDRHTVGGDLVGMKPGGIFDSSLGESDLAGLANATAGRVGRYRADQDVVEYIIGAGRPIGVDINGSTVSHYTVWRSSSGTLQTLFPGSVVR